MSNYFISRHKGAIDWANQQGIKIDEQITHLDINQLTKNDSVYGTLPINIVAQINAIGVRYFHLSLNLPKQARGKELTVKDMQNYGASLEEYTAKKV